MGVDCVTLMPSITPSFPILGPSFRKAERCAVKGCTGGLARGVREGGGRERDGIKARKSSVSKMNGSGIDDAEGARASEREKVSKNLPSKKSASAVGEKSLMDHSFLFGAPLCYFSCVSGRRGSGIPTLSRG